MWARRMTRSRQQRRSRRGVNYDGDEDEARRRRGVDASEMMRPSGQTDGREYGRHEAEPIHVNELEGLAVGKGAASVCSHRCVPVSKGLDEQPLVRRRQSAFSCHPTAARRSLPRLCESARGGYVGVSHLRRRQQQPPRRRRRRGCGRSGTGGTGSGWRGSRQEWRRGRRPGRCGCGGGCDGRGGVAEGCGGGGAVVEAVRLPAAAVVDERVDRRRRAAAVEKVDCGDEQRRDGDAQLLPPVTAARRRVVPNI
mmetsp:Transcript_19304/g.41673  ORF Transcript_19304/g.41673 Transcript_19304/m.41673 type:complete len:253 (-) Transcript_19304:954-1712(-)